LHPRLNEPPFAVRTGAVLSDVHVTLRDVVEVLPQASFPIRRSSDLRAQPLLTSLPSEEYTVGVPHASVAEAEPRAPFISPVVGLHPRLNEPPVAVRTGAVLSDVHVAVRDVVEVFAQASIAVNVLVCVRAQPLLTTLPSEEDTV